MKATINGVTTYFVGNIYEKTGEAETKYYYAGAQRIAMRIPGTLYYLLADHLGSTTVTTTATGGFDWELKYDPWGKVMSGSSVAEYTYTGPLATRVARTGGGGTTPPRGALQQRR